MDVDIDLKTSFNTHDYFDVISASMVKNKELKRHNVGVYFQNIPQDSMTKLSAIPYKQAEELGFLKIDFLHLEILNHFDNNNQIDVLSKTDPDWSLLESEDNVKKLFQISKQFKLIDMVKPKSIDMLADCLAIMRPGKRQLLYKYLENPKEIKKLLYLKDSNFSFKRSHAIAYATTIVLQMHLLKGGII